MNTRLRLSACLLTMLLVCGGARGSSDDAEKDSEKPSRPPSGKTLIDATHPAYTSDAGAQQDCLGRIAFDVPKAAEWATVYTSDAPILHGGFSENVFDQGDALQHGDTKIAVFGPLNPKAREELLGMTPKSRL